MDAHFGDDLSALGRAVPHLSAWGIVLAASAVAMYAAMERVARPRWHATTARAPAWGGPYRAQRLVAAHAFAAPPTVRAAALGCFVFGQLAVPALVVALRACRPDGLAVALMPAVAVAAATWSCGVALLRRSSIVPEAVRAVAVASLMLDGALLLMATAHLAVYEWTSRADGATHECSASVAVAACLFSVGAAPQAALMLVAVRRHRGAFAGTA